jgi:TldD protein
MAVASQRGRRAIIYSRSLNRARSMTSPLASLFERAGLDREEARQCLAAGLAGADDGELYLEYAQSEMLLFDNGRLKQATYNTDQGFGLRAVKEEAVGYAHSSEISQAALVRAADAVRAVKGGYCGTYAAPPSRSNVRLYGDENPLGTPDFATKVRLLETMDSYVRSRDTRVRQATFSLGASWQVVEILRADGETYRDVRPLVRVNVTVVVGEGDRQESGSHGYGGRQLFQICWIRRPGRARLTTRCGMRSRICRQYRHRRGKWTWCSAPAGVA